MNRALADALDPVLPAAIVATRPVTGGSINKAWRVDLSDGTRLFVKSNASPPPRFFETEAAGLDWLREGLATDHTLAVPGIVAWRDEQPSFLALEWIDGDVATGTGGADELFGAALAQLHLSGAAGFGWSRHGHIGDWPQSNTGHGDWAAFWREERLEPLVRVTLDRGSLPGRVRSGFDRLFGRLPELLGPDEPPARLHGDLWSGNRLVDGRRSWLVDPAPYGGHREVDLAMMRLFGGFGERCFASYDEVAPLPDGHEGRVALYQLYPLLVHVVLFGAAYAGPTLEALDRYA